MLVEDEPAYYQAIPKYPSKFFTFVLINDFQDTLPKHVIYFVTRSNERWNTVCR